MGEKLFESLPLKMILVNVLQNVTIYLDIHCRTEIPQNNKFSYHRINQILMKYFSGARVNNMK